MARRRYRLNDLVERRGESYNKLWRSIETLRESELINPETGDRGALLLSEEEVELLDRFLACLESCNGVQREALYALQMERLRQRVSHLEAWSEKLERERETFRDRALFLKKRADKLEREAEELRELAGVTASW